MTQPGARRPVLLFACFEVDAAAWLSELSSQAGEVELRAWPEVGDPTEVDYVLAWKTPREVWAGLTALKAVFSLGAGVDRLLGEPGRPAGVPLVSMSDPSLVTGMQEYVVSRVLHLHRRFDAYAEAQDARAWGPLPQPPPQDRRVGVMGLGRLGGACARSLAAQGFDVAGWSRGPKRIEGVATFAGADGLTAFARSTEILVCLLPLTPETEGVLDAGLFERLPRGAHLVNVARGAHLVEADLLDALSSGRISGATLDVFRTEPLPPEHPFWSHPRITVTPHVSAVTQPRTAAAAMFANLLRCERGEAMEGVVDPARGY